MENSNHVIIDICSCLKVVQVYTTVYNTPIGLMGWLRTSMYDCNVKSMGLFRGRGDEVMQPQVSFTHTRLCQPPLIRVQIQLGTRKHKHSTKPSFTTPLP